MANVPLLVAASDAAYLELQLGHFTLAASTALLRRDASRNTKSLLITFDGVNANRQDLNSGILSQSQMLAFFRLVAECLPHLETLRLEWNILLAQYYEQPPLIPLQVLQYILRDTNVESLTMYRIKLAGDETDYQKLTEATIQNESLQSVRIEFSSPVGSPNLDAFVVSLSKLAGLKDFEIIGFQGDPSRGCTSTSLQTLGAASRLRCLKLWGGILQNQDGSAVVNLAQGLSVSKTVKDLEVGLFQLDAASSAALATLLENNSSLERVWLDVQTPLHKETTSPLCTAMKKNNVITSFNVVSTMDETVKEGVLELFSSMVKKNCTLRHLTIRGSNELVAGNESQAQHIQAEIEFHLKLNRVGRQQLLNSTSKRSGHYKWLSMLGCECENASIVYYLLRRNPTFISQCVVTPVKCGKRMPQSRESSSHPQLPKRRRICFDNYEKANEKDTLQI